jgi:outer membrane protein assembly factor BamA
MGSRGRQDSKFRTWLREKMGERPAVFDQSAAENSAFEMEQYLNKVGFFYSSVALSVKQKGKYKIHAIYTIDPTLPYRYKTVGYAFDDTLIRQLASTRKPESRIKPGQVYNAFELDDERDRITNILKNEGYYFFSRDYIFFEVDSIMGSHEMNLKVMIKPNQVPSPAEPWKTIDLPHKRYFIRNIYVRPAFDPRGTQPDRYDTTLFTIIDQKGRRAPSDYYILHQNPLRVHPSTIAQSIFIRTGNPYRITDVTKTRSRLNELGLFSYNNIRFRKSSDPDTLDHGFLDCFIDLSRKKLHSFTIETEATNSGGRPGIGANVTYQNSNIFGGAEIFRLKARGALEAQKIFGDDADYSDDIPFFNTIETGLEASVIFPRFLLPVRQERFPKSFRPRTTLSFGLNYEDRPEYARWLTNLTFGYEWKESDRKQHQIFPFDWSLVNITTTPEFQETIDNEPNDRIKYQYTDNLIMALRYAYTYNTQDIRKIQDFFYFRGSAETAGNLLNIGNRVFGGTTDSLGNYLVFGIPYAQYVKIDGDFRYFNVISRQNSVAFRFFMGTGVSYSNGQSLPLEKGYYGGGANGMRGWPYRLLGPGSYSNPEDDFDRMGDLQLEANIEYRFPVYQFIKSALFADIGNIWLLQQEDSYPGGDFRFDRFYRELAIDVGLGLRLDFNFFILRVDFAIPLRDPAKPENERWVLNKWQLNDVIINFGIGYPF